MDRKNIKLIVYDFDGVMTDNRLYLSEDGKESVQCNRADGLGVSLIKEMKIPQMILSTETNSVVVKRAEKLNIDVLHGIENKGQMLKVYCDQNEIDLDNVLYIGNDINDEQAMSIVGYPVCPNDAYKSIKVLSTWVTQAKGGEGVVRELAEKLSNQ